MSVPILVFAVAVLVLSLLTSLVVLSLWLGDRLEQWVDERTLRKEQNQ